MGTGPGTEDTVAFEREAGRSTEPATSRLQPGASVGPYVVTALIGVGGMAEVYRARDPRLGRDVALKMVRAVRSETAACGSLCSLLAREARTLAQLSHPGLLAVHDVGEHEGCVYLAMGLVDGVTLREWVARGPVFGERLAVLVEAGRALAAAHAARIVHRDVKPDNILVDRSGRVVVSDFGLARGLSDLDEDGFACGCTGGAGVRVELDGMIVGTPHYMSPEQLEGRVADSRSDQFGFAVTAWETLHGALPFGGNDLDSIRASVAAQQIEPPPGSPVPGAANDVLRRAMRVSPSTRYPNLSSLVDRLAATGDA